MKIADRQQIQKAIIKTLSAGPTTWQAINRAAHSCDVSCDQSQVRVILNGLISAGVVKRRDQHISNDIGKRVGFKITYLECYSLVG